MVLECGTNITRLTSPVFYARDVAGPVVARGIVDLISVGHTSTARD